jgi:energy-coupling factor transporter ATP-binding protein EcfA2
MQQNPLSLSGGQTAALALVCAIEMRRPILCVDETLAHLDVISRPRAWAALREFAHSGRIVIVSDNQYDLMAEYVDMCVLMEGARVQSVLPPDDAFCHPVAKQHGTVPTVTDVGGHLWPERNDPPISFQRLLELLAGAADQPNDTQR